MNGEKLVLSGAEVYTPQGVLPSATVAVENGKIASVEKGPCACAPAGATVIDARGKKLVPGFIDIHIHGGAGIDTNEADAAGFAKLSAALASHGVTSFLPTTLACSPDALRGIMANVSQAMTSPLPGAKILGLHLESNFISPKFCGAQPPENIFTPDSPSGLRIKALLEEFPGTVKIVTLAPEVDGGMELIKWLSAKGIIVSLGHSAADYETAKAAFAAGATQVTHLFNAMPPLHHRHPGLVGAALENDSIFVEIICDGNHVHPVLLKTVLRAKGEGKMVAVTDALKASGMGVGEFKFGGRTVKVTDGFARLADGTIAGSVATMDYALKVLLSAGCTARQAMRMVSATPAESLGLANYGVIAPGAAADLVLLDEKFNPFITIVGGKIVFPA